MDTDLTGKCIQDMDLKEGEFVRCVKSTSNNFTEFDLYEVIRNPETGKMGVIGETGLIHSSSSRFIKQNPSGDPSDDIVNRPAHYTKWKLEPVEFLMRNNVPGWMFNVVKYVMRAGSKLYPCQDERESEITDLKKARRYIDMRINLLNGEPVL
ncbi:MAG: DUF3310 domain-containing protein [Gammaproteobacteria bacterium]|nr:DUF3310 domain-containing protein [Gammaproteobacteria bacterium]